MLSDQRKHRRRSGIDRRSWTLIGRTNPIAWRW
jgi:hypothetical protein